MTAETGRKLVLIIEDNEDDRQLYGDLLWYNGYDVIHRADGESGISAAMEVRPDLVLLDIRLRGALDGLNVARALRELGFSEPVIVLSGLPRRDVGEAAIEAGASVFLEKPMSPVNVVTEVMHHIGYASGGREEG